MKLIPTLKSITIIIATAVLLVACAAGGGGGGSSAAGPSVSVFSHNAYTFAPNIAGDAVIGITPQRVGQVQLNNNRIRGLVAARIGVTDPQKISALSAGTDYNISYSIDALVGSSAATFFSIDAATGAIEVSDTIGVGLTFNAIREFVGNSIKVKAIITFAVPQRGSAAIKSTIENSVNVAILNAASRVDITSITTASLVYNRASVSAAGTANFNVAGAINENNNLQDPVSFGLPNNPAGLSRNPVAAFAIRSILADSASAQVTLFYDVRNPANVNQGCGASSTPNSIEGALYIDNADLTLKASTSFNREAATNPQNNIYQCRLAVSTDGETYYPLAFVVNATGSAVGNQINSANSNIVANLARVFQSNTLIADSSCSNNDCYYGDLAITITDVNEAPTVSLVGGGSNFDGSTEGVGVLSTYVSVAGNPYQESLTPLATDEAKVDDINLRINDEDSDQTTIGEISLTVAPSHRGITDAFSVQRPSGNNPDGYELVVNTALLDYEAFSPAQLTADDKAIYKLTITARDNRTSSLASTETFNFEVVDVKYPPVFVDPAINPSTYSTDKPLESDAAFVKETNIITGTAGTPLYLLSGVRAFERHRIGRLAAVDPESGSGNDFTYTIVEPISTVIHSNLQLIANTAGNNRGHRLIVAGGGLTETAATPVTLQVAAPSGATRTLGIMLAVDNSRYADEGLVLNPADTPDITFNPGLALVGSAAEESPVSDNVIISFRNTADLAIPAFNALSEVSTNNKGSSITPTFALLTVSDFNGISPALGSFSSDINQPSSSSNLGAGIEDFVINSVDGRISVRPGTAAFSFPAVFTLPVLVTPAIANQAPRFIAGMSDITIATIATTDVNTPPQARSSAGDIQLNLANKLTAQVNENLPAGTELARFTITDDNQALANGQPTVMFSGATASDANTLLLLDRTKNTDGSTTASIRSRVEFDYENPTHRSTLQNLVINITDAGSFTLLDSTTMQLLPAPVRTGNTIETVEVAVDLTLQDAIEILILEAGTGTDYSILESAAQGDSVAASGNQVVAILSNANASRINFSVSGAFAGILEVVPAASPIDGMLALGLTVADPVRLENLGDGRTFRATIVARDRVSRRAGSVSIGVTITNDPANSNINQTVIDTAIAQLGRIRINEQDVVGRSTYPIPAANFSISLTDLAADADEFFHFTGQVTPRRLVEPLLSLEDVSFATSTDLNPNEFVATANILNLELGSDNIYRLTIADTNFVEKALFGDINFNLVASARGVSSSTDTSASIAIAPAAPKNVVYAAAATTTPATPPVYALAYTQTPYDNGQLVANTSGISVGIIDATTAFSTALRGVTADAININGTTAVYNTLALDGASGRFIARDYATAAGLITSNDNLGNIQLNTDNKLVINFAGNTGTDLSSELEILRPDATGGFVDARAEFNAYFDLAVNNTASPKHIIISQKVFSQADNATRKYNALDTIQLYRGATETHTLNYFIRARSATDGPTTASNYALAQFSVVVTAAGIRVVPAITGFADNNPDLAPATFSYDSTPVSVSWIIRDNSAGANTITQTLVSSDTSVCSVANPTPSFVSPTAVFETFTSTVDALSPGTCTLTINATEDGASNTATINIVFPNLPPTVTAASLTNSGNVVDIGSGFSTSGYRANSVGGSFVVTINAENVDPGDDDSRDPDVTFTQTGGNSCTIAESITSANYANSIATAAYTITNPTGGACGAITISVKEEDTQGANQDIAGTLVIPADTFIFDTAPTLNRPGSEPVFAGYAALTTFSVSVATNDAGAAAGTVTIAAVPTGSCTATASAIANGVATITVTPTATSGLCEVAVTATEDGLESNEAFSFTLSEIAPLVSIAGQTSPYTPTAVLANGTIIITLTATKQDISNDGVDFGVASNPGGCDIAGISGTTSYTGSGFSVPLADTVTATQDITISLPANRFGQGGTCEIEFTAREDGQVSAPFRVVAIFNLIEQPPLIAITAGARRLNLPAIPDTVHEITVTATKQDATDIAEVMFTTSFAADSSFAGASNNDDEHCDVNITNPTASYVGGGVGGIGGIATTNITISYSGPLSDSAQCGVNVAVTEGTKTSNLPFINTFNSAIYVQFLPVNQPPLIELFGVPTGTPFPDERPRIGVQATKQDDIAEAILNSEVMVIDGACMAILDGDDISITPSKGFGHSSSVAYYRIILDAANAASAIAAERECELDFSVTETEAKDNNVPGFNDPAGTQKTTNRTIVLSFAQELPPLFINISISSGSSVTSPSNRDVLVDITLEKQDTSNTRDLTLPDTINSVGDVCTATLRDPARYSATSIGSRATGTYAVRINNVAISESTACGAFIFTATDGSATSTSTASASPAITFTPSVELPPSLVLNAAASTIDDLLNSETATIAVTITKQDNAEANLLVTWRVSGGSCSIREFTNTGYGSNPVIGSTATASYEVTHAPSQNIDSACTVSISATEDGSPISITQEVSFSSTPTQVSFVGGRLSAFSNSPSTRVVLSLVRKEDTTPDRNVVMRITRIVASYGNGTTLPDSWCAFGPLANSATFPSATIGVLRNGDFVFTRLSESWPSRYQCAVDYSADVDGDGADSLPPATTTRIYQVTPYLGVAPGVTVSAASSNSSVAGTPVTVNVIATKRLFYTNPVVFAMDFNVSDCMITKQGGSSGRYTFVGDMVTQTYSINRPTAGNCTIPNSMFTAIDVGIIGRGTGFTNVAFTSSAPVVSAGPIFFGDAAPVPATFMTQREATIYVDGLEPGFIAEVDTRSSGCRVIPESFMGSDGNSEAIFTLSQGPGSVGSTTCVDSSIRGSGTDGGLNIKVFDRSDVVQASREYADEEITFTPAAVGLHLAAADYNLLEDVQVNLPQGDEQIFVKDGTDTGDNITGNHIYNFLEARRWFFGNSGNGDALSSYIIARGSSGSLNPRVLTPSWLDHYFTDNQAPISQTFFIKPTQVNDTTTDITTREFSPHSVVAASSLADDGYDYAFFSNLTDYQVDGYLKFSSRPDLATNAYAVGGGDENAGAFARTFSTAGSTAGATSAPTSVSSYQPLIAIATAADSPTSGFGLKARLCRISIIAGSDNHISALSGKALSCDAATAQLLDATAAAKIISLADWTATDRIVKVGTLPTGGETCRSAGLVIYPLRASADNFSDNVFCGGTDVTGGALAVNYAGDSIGWSFQHYLGSRAIAPNAPESMAQSGIYLAEVYPVPTDSTDMSILLGAPIRVLFEVFAK